MKKRDLEILKDLERFRVMSRDDIVNLHFSHLKNPITNANGVLKRLVRDSQIEVSTDFRPFVYFPAGSTMKKNSTKIPHFLEIVNVYRQLKRFSDPKMFIVEPKYKKGLAEPDVFMIFKGTPFFVEIQRNTYSQNVMDNKIKRYESLKDSGILANEPWQREDKTVFPFIIMITDTRYEINSNSIRVFQVPSILDFMKSSQKKSIQEVKSGGVKFKIG